MTLPDQGITTRIYTTDGPNFVIDTSVPSVDLNCPTDYDLADQNLREFFQAGDNLFIESAELNFPYQFGQGPQDRAGGNELLINLQWENRSGTETGQPLNQDGAITLGNPNCIIPVKTPLFYPVVDNTDFKLQVIGINGTASMIYCPPDFAEEEAIPIQVVLTVRHTFPLVA